MNANVFVYPAEVLAKPGLLSQPCLPNRLVKGVRQPRGTKQRAQ